MHGRDTRMTDLEQPVFAWRLPRRRRSDAVAGVAWTVEGFREKSCGAGKCAYCSQRR